MKRRDFVRTTSAGAAGTLYINSFLGCINTESIETSLEKHYKHFQNPPDHSRMFIRWWWNGNRLDAKEIIRELEVMQVAGITGIEINPIAMPEHANKYGYDELVIFEEKWLDMLELALKEAKKRNMPRGRILRDDTLMDLAGSNPKNDNQLNKIRGFPKNQNNPFRSDIISVLGKAATDDSMMEVTASVRKDIKPPAATVELLRVLLKHVAEQQDVASRLIASAQQLDDLATGNHLDHPCLSGWRHDIFGKQAMQLIDGKLALSLSGNEIRLTEIG